MLKALAQGVDVLPVFSSNTAKFLQDAAGQNALRRDIISIPVDEIYDVGGLKRHLYQVRGFPLGFRQRFLLHGERLEDAFKLDTPMDLDVVLLPFAEVSQRQVHDLVEAAGHGSTAVP